MISTNCTVDRKTSWFTRKSSIDIALTSDISSLEDGAQALIRANFVRNIFSYVEQQTSSVELENLSGRNYASFSSGAKVNPRPSQEEVWFLQGKTLELDEQPKTFSQLRERSPSSTHAFSSERLSSFDSFSETKRIRYSCRDVMQGDGGLIPRKQPSRIASAFPLLIETARVGLEFFDSVYIGSRFGLAPKIVGHLFVEVDGASISASIYEENLNPSQTLPLESRGIWHVLGRSYTDSGLVDGLSQKVADCLDDSKSGRVECSWC